MCTARSTGSHQHRACAPCGALLDPEPAHRAGQQGLCGQASPAHPMLDWLTLHLTVQWPLGLANELSLGNYMRPVLRTPCATCSTGSSLCLMGSVCHMLALMVGTCGMQTEPSICGRSAGGWSLSGLQTVSGTLIWPMTPTPLIYMGDNL